MFYLFESYAYLLIAAAIIPAIILLKKVYTLDHLEPEPPALIGRLLLFGVISTFIALVLETIGGNILESMDAAGAFATDSSYYFAEFFFIVGPAEELSKYIMLRIGSWKNPNFNCQFDGIVYSVTVSLGFALWENIKYVFSYGLGTALVRAVTAVPGHACFGVFMGVFYGAAKRLDIKGYRTGSLVLRIISVVIPLLIHGAYDYLATISSTGGNLIFIAFVAALFWICLKLVKKMAAVDRYMDNDLPVE